MLHRTYTHHFLAVWVDKLMLVHHHLAIAWLDHSGHHHVATQLLTDEVRLVARTCAGDINQQLLLYTPELVVCRPATRRLQPDMMV